MSKRTWGWAINIVNLISFNIVKTIRVNVFFFEISAKNCVIKNQEISHVKNIAMFRKVDIDYS